MDYPNTLKARILPPVRTERTERKPPTRRKYIPWLVGVFLFVLIYAIAHLIYHLVVTGFFTHTFWNYVGCVVLGTGYGAMLPLTHLGVGYILVCVFTEESTQIRLFTALALLHVTFIIYFFSNIRCQTWLDDLEVNVKWYLNTALFLNITLQ